jgi:hypothetical protein
MAANTSSFCSSNQWMPSVGKGSLVSSVHWIILTLGFPFWGSKIRRFEPVLRRRSGMVPEADAPYADAAGWPRNSAGDGLEERSRDSCEVMTTLSETFGLSIATDPLLHEAGRNKPVHCCSWSRRCLHIEQPQGQSVDAYSDVGSPVSRCQTSQTFYI